MHPIAFLGRGKFSFRPRNDPRFYNGQYPFIQTGDVVTASEIHGDIQYIQTLNEEGLKVSKLFKPNIILITIAANIGDTAILRYPACFPDSVVAIEPKNDNLSIDYLNYYLKYVKNYLVNLAPQSAQKNINLQQLSPTPVVIPPKEIQDKIVEKMDNAYATKKQKELEAQQLLDSIDDYLLGELGIELPEPEENTIQNRIFIRNLSEVSGDRLDPFYHNENIKKMKKSIINNWGLNYFKEIIEDMYRYPTFYDISYQETGIPIIKGENIDKHGQISLTQNFDYIDMNTHNKYARTHLRENDLIFTVRGNVGKVGLFKGFNLSANINANVIKIRLIKKVNSHFYWSYLNSIIGKLLIKNIESGQVQKTITVKDINNILIPVPPIEKQIEISEHITTIRNQAKQLQQQAKTDLEQAKQEVEATILGEDEP